MKILIKEIVDLSFILVNVTQSNNVYYSIVHFVIEACAYNTSFVR